MKEIIKRYETTFISVVILSTWIFAHFIGIFDYSALSVFMMGLAWAITALVLDINLARHKDLEEEKALKTAVNKPQDGPVLDDEENDNNSEPVFKGWPKKEKTMFEAAGKQEKPKEIEKKEEPVRNALKVIRGD